ncbi:MAG: DUF2934 domain-containing protein [Nitrospirota bacterium]
METQSAQERPVKTRRVVDIRTKSSAFLAVPSKAAVSVCDDPQVVIAKRAYDFYVDWGCWDGRALDDWLEAEREVLSQVPPM